MNARATMVFHPHPAPGLALAGTLVTPFPPHLGELTAAESACIETVAAKLASPHRAGTLPDIATVWLTPADGPDGGRSTHPTARRAVVSVSFRLPSLCFSEIRCLGPDKSELQFAVRSCPMTAMGEVHQLILTARFRRASKSHRWRPASAGASSSGRRDLVRPGEGQDRRPA